ncbi:MAG: DUF3662 and FHA domain-containing protein [Coriobacteriia bacterium]|nr:DUF3662 and FHA domain-containing protein [Coriobacteriia bacterium]
MGLLSKFEGKMEGAVEGAAGRMSDAPISPVQIAKKAEKAMRREKMVGAGKQYAPTLYTVLVNVDDDRRLFGMYPTLAGEIETYLAAKAADEGLAMDGQPLVRFIADDALKHGKFEIVAEPVAAPIIAQLRQEEMQRYGLIQNQAYGRAAQQPAAYAQPQAAPAYNAPQPDPYQPDPYAPHELPYVPEEEIDRSIDYGEYTFNSEDFEDYQNRNSAPLQGQAGAAAAAAAGAGMAAAGAANAASAANAANPYASARPATGPRLIDIATNHVYPLNKRQLVAGRGQDCDIVIADINASRRHATFSQEAHGVWVLADAGSTNGTLLNGQLIDGAQTLYEGDQITMGITNLFFTMA